MYSSTLSLTSALYSRERPGTHCTGGWVGRRAGLDGCGKSRPHRDSIPGPSSPWRVAIPTALSRSTHLRIRRVSPKHSTGAFVPVAAASDHEVVTAGNVKLHHFGNRREKKRPTSSCGCFTPGHNFSSRNCLHVFGFARRFMFT